MPITLKIPSDSRDITHTVKLNYRSGQPYSCECEDHAYRKRVCKHMERARKELARERYRQAFEIGRRFQLIDDKEEMQALFHKNGEQAFERLNHFWFWLSQDPTFPDGPDFLIP